MIPRVFSDRPDVVPHFVPLWDSGGFHGCDLPPVLPGAGNPRRPPFHSRLARAFPLAAGFATGDMTESSHGAASSSASADRSFAWRRSCMLADRGRRRARGPKRARPTAVACHGQVGVKGADSMARSASALAPGRRHLGIEPIGIRRPRPRHPRSAPDSRGTSATLAPALARSLGHSGGTGHRGRGRNLARGPDGCGATNDDGCPAVDSGHINYKRHQPDTVA